MKCDLKDMNELLFESEIGLKNDLVISLILNKNYLEQRVIDKFYNLFDKEKILLIDNPENDVMVITYLTDYGTRIQGRVEYENGDIFINCNPAKSYILYEGA